MGDEKNLEDVRRCVEFQLQGRMSNAAELHDAVEELVQRSEGLFLYLRFIFAELKAAPEVTLEDVKKYPKSISAAFEENFTRLFQALGSSSEDASVSVSKAEAR